VCVLKPVFGEYTRKGERKEEEKKHRMENK